jgi:hypothetical protein
LYLYVTWHVMLRVNSTKFGLKIDQFESNVTFACRPAGSDVFWNHPHLRPHLKVSLFSLEISLGVSGRQRLDATCKREKTGGV